MAAYFYTLFVRAVEGEPSRDRTSRFVALQGGLVPFHYTISTLLVRLQKVTKVTQD